MANNTIKRVWNANKLVSIEDLSGMTFQGENGGHTFEVSGVDDSGSAVSISGTVTAVFLRADNAAISISGSVSSGKAVATLTQNCYTVPGRFMFTIFVAANSQKTAIYSATGNVARTDGVATGSVPPLVTDSIQTGSITVSGDATVASLDVTSRRCFATLSSDGWYRVLKTAYEYGASGTIINFYIGRPYGDTPAEAHKISFFAVGGGNSVFLDETSDSNSICIDYIRCTHDSDYKYFDVHYNTSASNEVYVYFDVYGKGQLNGTSVSMGLASVVPSPAGEALIASYEFAEKTDRISDTTTSDVHTIVERTGKLITVTLEAAGGVSCPQGQYTTVATIPSWAYPKSNIFLSVDPFGSNNIIGGVINTSGDVRLYPVLSATTYYRFTITYKTA